MATPRDDLAAGLWTLHYNFGHGYGREFLESYGARPTTEKEMARLRRRYARTYRAVSTARQQ